MKGDTYKTIKSTSQGIFKDKGSRFLSFAYPVSSIDEIKPILEKLRKEYHDARHHCYAYLIGHDNSLWRVNDDGEPSGTGGRPILGQIKSFELTYVLIVVVRYFGGTLLGVSGLINAYKEAAADALLNAEIIISTIQDYYEIYYPYSAMNEVMKVLKDENISQYDQKFELDCCIKIRFRISVREKTLEKLERIEGLRLNFIETK
jgi:uncharacterized YigZ family protein